MNLHSQQHLGNSWALFTQALRAGLVEVGQAVAFAFGLLGLTALVLIG